MKLSYSLRALAATPLLLGALAAQAADFNFSGNAVYNTDVIRVGFDLGATAGTVKLWTDSWQSGLNFDPVVAVWAQTGSGYTLVTEVDDDDTIGAGQGSFDAGIQLSSLAAGHYLVTLTASPNYANGSTLSAGFAFDGSTPVAIPDWTQPSNNPNTNDQKGTLWSLHLSGVDQAAMVPEPATWALLVAGIGLIGLTGLRRQRNS